MSQALISARALSYQLGERQILRNISLSIAPQQIVTLIGPNGAGKSTLVKLLLGLLPLQQGQVQRLPNLRIGYMPQRLQLEPTMPIRVSRFLALAGRRTPVSPAKALADVGASRLIDSPLHGLSGGEMQRVLLARALLQAPQLLVLDEPVQGVDVSGQTELYRLISHIRDEHHCGVLMVSHDLHLVMSATDEVICLNQHVCCHGHPEQVSTDPAYLALFGPRQADTLAVYTHRHNHRHDLGGDIIKGEQTPHG